MFNLFAPKQPKAPTIDIKVPWSNRSKILAGLTVAAAVGTGVSVAHDLKVAAEEATSIPEAMVDQMLADDAAAMTGNGVEVTSF